MKCDYKGVKKELQKFLNNAEALEFVVVKDGPVNNEEKNLAVDTYYTDDFIEVEDDVEEEVENDVFNIEEEEEEVEE